MNAVTAAAIAHGLSALIEIWRLNANKPPAWVPTEQDWTDMLALNDKPLEQYEAEAAARLGIVWPPADAPLGRVVPDDL